MDKAAPGAGKASCKGCVCGLGLGVFFPPSCFYAIPALGCPASRFPFVLNLRDKAGIEEQPSREAQGGW